MSGMNMDHAARVAVAYKQAVAAISRQFMDGHPDLLPHVMTIALMEVSMGLYREMTGSTRARYMAGTEALWDKMNELEGYHE